MAMIKHRLEFVSLLGFVLMGVAAFGLVPVEWHLFPVGYALMAGGWLLMVRRR